MKTLRRLIDEWLDGFRTGLRHLKRKGYSSHLIALEKD